MLSDMAGNIREAWNRSCGASTVQSCHEHNAENEAPIVESHDSKETKASVQGAAPAQAGDRGEDVAEAAIRGAGL
jgi:hypothetical protein